MSNYILYPSNYAGLAMEMRRLVDDYQNGQIALDVFIGTLEAWRQNCDFMLDETGSLVGGVARLIGKKRSGVVNKALLTGAMLVG